MAIHGSWATGQRSIRIISRLPVAGMAPGPVSTKALVCSDMAQKFSRQTSRRVRGPAWWAEPCNGRWSPAPGCCLTFQRLRHEFLPRRIKDLVYSGVDEHKTKNMRSKRNAAVLSSQDISQNITWSGITWDGKLRHGDLLADGTVSLSISAQSVSSNMEMMCV